MLKSSFSPKKSGNQGNVLFIILIAIALFSALTYAVTSSNKGTQTASKERGTISASDLMGFSANVEKAVARTLGQGISESDLSFENSIWLLGNGTATSPASNYTNCTVDDCKIFNVAGAGLSAQTFPGGPLTAGLTDIQGGHGAVYNLKITGVGTAANDLVLIIALISRDSCLEVNKVLNVTNPSGEPPADVWTTGAAQFYAGNFTSGGGGAADEIGDVATEVVGKSAACVGHSGASGAYYYYQVLTPR